MENRVDQSQLDIPTPEAAVSIRQPWAWAIVNGFKDIENRSALSRHLFARLVGVRFFVHASKEPAASYAEAEAFIRRLGVDCPPFEALDRGGYVGVARCVAVVDRHPSPWFVGPVGLVLADARPCPLIPARGQIGVFKVG